MGWPQSQQGRASAWQVALNSVRSLRYRREVCPSPTAYSSVLVAWALRRLALVGVGLTVTVSCPPAEVLAV